MQERHEIPKKPVGNEMSNFGTPYFLANLGFKTGVISFTVSAFTQPFQALLTHIQLPTGSPTALSGGIFRGLYRGFVPYAVAGQKRGAVAVSAKQANREEEVEAELPIRQRWFGTFFFSQADLILSNGLSGKSKLESAGIITKANFNWSLVNWAKLTCVNWGSRSVAGFVNFAAIGFMGDYVSSFYKFETDIYNKIAGGASAGVIATIFTTIPNSYGDKKLLASKMEHGRLVTSSPFTMFGNVKSHVKTIGVKEALVNYVKMSFLKEVLVRSPQTALTFSIIFGVDHLLGHEPLKKVWPGKNEEIDSEKPRCKSSRM